MYLASFTVFESSDAYSSTGGQSFELVDGVRALQDLDAALPVGPDAFFSILVLAEGAASEAPLDSVTIEKRDLELRDYGPLLTCGTGFAHAFGAEVGEFTDAALALSTPPAPIAVAWKYTLEATALAAEVHALPDTFFVQGPPYAPVEAAEISFTDQAKEYCIRVIARDLRTDLEYSEVFCGAPDLPLENVDSIGDCRLEDLQNDALRARWCRTKPESTCEEATAAPEPALEPEPQPAPEPNSDPAPASKPEHRTSQACALTRAPKPDSGHAAATWAFALLVAARARRRRAQPRE